MLLVPNTCRPRFFFSGGHSAFVLEVGLACTLDVSTNYVHVCRYIIVDEQTAGACTKTSVGGLAWDARVCMCTQDDTACHHGGAGDQVKRSV